MDHVTVRPAELSDAADIQSIREHYALHSLATFDTNPPSVAKTRQWLDTFSKIGSHRFLVAVDCSGILGFACSAPYRDHPAFSATVELSVYLKPDHRSRGLGSTLYDELLGALAGEELLCALVGIALPNDASVRLHRRHGFREVGIFENYARKADETISSLWMQKMLS